MSSKLTLSINQIVIEEAKKYAKSSGKSLSNIVEEYLKSLALKDEKNKRESTLKIVRELKGSVKLPEGFISYKDILEDALMEKYLGK